MPDLGGFLQLATIGASETGDPEGTPWAFDEACHTQKVGMRVGINKEKRGVSPMTKSRFYSVKGLPRYSPLYRNRIEGSSPSRSTKSLCGSRGDLPLCYLFSLCTFCALLRLPPPPKASLCPPSTTGLIALAPCFYERFPRKTVPTWLGGVGSPYL